MSDASNFDRFIKCAVEVLSVDAGQVTTEARFAEDLDADSLDLVELVMALEEEFDVTVEEEELEGVGTVGAAYELVPASSDDGGAGRNHRPRGGGPCGIGADAFWDGLNRPAPEGERRVAGFRSAPYFANPKEARRADRFTQFAWRLRQKHWKVLAIFRSTPLVQGSWWAPASAAFRPTKNKS